MVDAKEKLCVLWQDTSTVSEYAALFKELMARTGYSQSDLQDRFYEHLSSWIKDELVHTAHPTGTLDELITAASHIDVRVCQQCMEKDREKKRLGVITRITTTQTPPHTTPFTPPATDPILMEVDATQTQEEFMSQMRGRCFGCGSTTHTKKDGNHDQDLCPYCKHIGHREVVCIKKFLGQPRAQKATVAVLTEEGSIRNDSPDKASSKSDNTKMVALTLTTLAQLIEQQKSLAEQVAVLRDSDF